MSILAGGGVYVIKDIHNTQNKKEKPHRLQKSSGDTHIREPARSTIDSSHAQPRDEKTKNPESI